MLVAPDAQTREFVTATYSFDEHVTEPVSVTDSPDGWRVRSNSLTLDLTIGRPTVLGRVLSVVPARVAISPAWCAVSDPVARVALRGVRTRGTAGRERKEWYGATSMRAVTAIAGSWRGTELGVLAPVDPPCRFGFSSTPRPPSVTSVVTTIERSV